MQKRSRNFENLIMLYLQSQLPKCTIEGFYTTESQMKIDDFNVDAFFTHCKIIFETMGCYFHYFSCQKASMTEETQRGLENWKHDKLRKK